MSKFRKKPIVIEAFKWTGDQDQTEDPEWIIEAIRNGDAFFDRYIPNIGLRFLYERSKALWKFLVAIM
jgi:hypothetical protein